MIKKYRLELFLLMFLVMITGCSTYKAKPLSFKTPAAYDNLVNVAGAQIAGRAYVEKQESVDAFGFDIRSAGMLPVQLVFDNFGDHTLEINGRQTFLEDDRGNLWPILQDKFAYERATQYAQTKKIFKEGAYSGMLGAAAGTLIGAAIGIVSGEDIAFSAGQGAAVGAAAGGTLGGIKGYTSDDARKEITRDLRDKSLQHKAIEPKNLAHGIIFFPGEALTAKRLRLQMVETDTGITHNLILDF